MRKILFGLLAVSILAFAGFSALSPAVVSADAQSEVCQGIVGAGGSCNDTSGTSISAIIKRVLNILSALIGVVAVVMIMVSGFKYVTAGGDSAKVGSAKNTLIYAIIGLVIVALAQSITQFVLKNVTTSGKTENRQTSMARLEA